MKYSQSEYIIIDRIYRDILIDSRYFYTEEGPHLAWTINMIRHSFISLIKKPELWNCRCDHPRTLIRSLWLASYLSIRTRLSCVSCAFRVHLPIRPHTVRHHQSERNNLTADAAVAVQWSSCVDRPPPIHFPAIHSIPQPRHHHPPQIPQQTTNQCKSYFITKRETVAI